MMRMTRYKVPNNNSLIVRVSVELLAILVLVYPMMHIYVFLQGDLAPFQRGFYCDDESIKHPNLREEISVRQCFIMWACIALLLIPAVELLHETVFETRENPRICRIPWVVIELYRILGYYALGSLCTLLTTEMAKYKIGRLRPYFLTVCNVQLTDDLCKDDHGYMKFVTNYTCSASEHEVHEASKSFLSGHSSFSFYAATFLIFYIHARLAHIPKDWDSQRPFRTFKILFRGLKILRPFLQFGIFSLAFYIALSRISDYKHHPGDVVMGSFVGVFFALLIILFLLNIFNKPRIFKYVELDERGTASVDLLDSRPHSEAARASGSGHERTEMLERGRSTH